MHMTDTLIVLGAGYTGARLARAALARGAHVRVTSRDPDKLADLAALGAQTVRWDALDDPDLGAAFDGVAPGAHVVYSLPTLFRTYEPARHLAPLARATAAARAAGAARFVYYSSTSVYGDHGGAWIDEDTAREPQSDLGRMRVDLEDHVLANPDGLPGAYVARLVGIYGPGRTLDGYIRRGVYAVARPEKRTNRIHVDDIVSATLAILERAPDGARAYDVTDGAPATVAEVVDFVVSRLGLDPPPVTTIEEVARRSPAAAARWRSKYRCRGQRLRDELGWAPEFADVIAGYEAMIASGELS
jgi:nucleoside-diphosphate-sugar epimerase